MRERALLLVLIGACLLSLLVAHRQHEAVEESLREVERLTARHQSKSSQLQSAMEKNVELSEQITHLAEESTRHRKSASEARRAKETLEATVSRLEATLEENLQHLQERLADLMKNVAGLSSTLRERATPSKAEADRILEEVARLTTRLDEQRGSLLSLSRKMEILGRMLAADGRPLTAAGTGRPPPKIEASVGAFGPERNEIALVGDLAELEPGHVVWVTRDGLIVARAEVFRVDPTARLAAARVVWEHPGRSPGEGDRVTTDPPVDQTQGSLESSGERQSSERVGSGAGREGEQDSPQPPPEGPISSEVSGAGGPSTRPRPPPPPQRPDGDD